MNYFRTTLKKVLPYISLIIATVAIGIVSSLIENIFKNKPSKLINNEKKIYNIVGGETK